jgi:D-psicose/D-tagatose/L-ribulose 3-epimerase
VIRFGVHSSLWTSGWTREGAELSVRETARHGLQVVEIALLKPDKIDVAHSRELFARHDVAPTASLGLPAEIEASRHPDEARDAGEALAVGAPYLKSLAQATGLVAA